MVAGWRWFILDLGGLRKNGYFSLSLWGSIYLSFPVIAWFKCNGHPLNEEDASYGNRTQVQCVISAEQRPDGYTTTWLIWGFLIQRPYNGREKDDGSTMVGNEIESGLPPVLFKIED
jgi:hypothetical protein